MTVQSPEYIPFFLPSKCVKESAYFFQYDCIGKYTHTYIGSTGNKIEDNAPGSKQTDMSENDVHEGSDEAI